MKSRSYSVFIAVLVFGSVICQNAEELTIPVETDNQFPPDHSESDGQNEYNGITIVDGPDLESTTVLPPVTNNNDVDVSTLIKENGQVTVTTPDPLEFLCPESCACTTDSDSNNYIVDCSGHGLTEYPTPIDLKTTILKLHNNKLTVIPKEISELINLKDLDANDNLITELEYGSVGELQELVSLKLANNRFEEYPVELEYSLALNKLEVLDLGGNGFTTTLSPEIFSNFEALRKLTLPDVTPELIIELCSVLKKTLEMVGAESCKNHLYESDATINNGDDSLDATLPGLIPFSLADAEKDTKNFNDMSAKLWHQDISNTPRPWSNEETETTAQPETLATTVPERLDEQPYPAVPGIKAILNISPLPDVHETPKNPETELTSTSTTSIPEALETLSGLGTKETRDTSRIPYASETTSYINVKERTNTAIMTDGLETVSISDTTSFPEAAETQPSLIDTSHTPIFPQVFETLSTPLSKETSETESLPEASEILRTLQTRDIPNISSIPEIPSTSPTQETTVALDTSLASALPPTIFTSETNKTSDQNLVPKSIEPLFISEINETPDTPLFSKEPDIGDITSNLEIKNTPDITLASKSPEISTNPEIKETSDTLFVPIEDATHQEIKVTPKITIDSEIPEINENSNSSPVPETSLFTSSADITGSSEITSPSKSPDIQYSLDLNEIPNTSSVSQVTEFTPSPGTKDSSELSLVSHVGEISSTSEITEISLTTEVPKEPEFSLSPEAKATHQITLVPETPKISFSWETKETPNPTPISEIRETSSNPDETTVPEAPMLNTEKEDTHITSQASEVPVKFLSTTTEQISSTPPVLKALEVDIKSNSDNMNKAANAPPTKTSPVLDITETSEKPSEPKIPETPPVPNTNEQPVNDFSLRTAVNNVPEEKVAMQNIITEIANESNTNETDVKVGATTVTKSSGGVDKSVIAVIVAGMVIIVAVITIKKNWSSIKKRFSSTPRPNDRSGRNANGTTPEEVPLQDKSPV